MKMWLSFSFLFPLFACSSARLEHKEYKSPDGKNSIIITSSDRGACCSTNFEAILNKSTDDKKLFSGSGSGKFYAKWTDSDSAVIYVEHIHEYSLVSRFLKTPPTKKDGSENSLSFKFVSN
jgi:hypothetical protein